MKTHNVALTEKELKAVLSALLFSSSVNVVSNTHEDFQLELLELAVKIKNEYDPSVMLEDVQFIEEENYEEVFSARVLEEFENNLKVIKFDHI